MNSWEQETHTNEHIIEKWMEIQYTQNGTVYLK